MKASKTPAFSCPSNRPSVEPPTQSSPVAAWATEEIVSFPPEERRRRPESTQRRSVVALGFSASTMFPVQTVHAAQAIWFTELEKVSFLQGAHFRSVLADPGSVT